MIPGMAEMTELDQNIKACEDETPLSGEELQKMEEIKQQLGTDFCRRCNYCAPCTVGINIPSVFLFAGYLQRYNLADWAKAVSYTHLLELMADTEDEAAVEEAFREFIC